MTIEENLQENIDTGSSQDLASAEASLDNALSSLKQNTEPKRETLKLPKKEETQEAPEEEIVSPEDQEFDPKEFVEVESPQIQKKINYLYKQVKSGGEVNSLLRHELQKLTNALEQKEINEKTLAKKLFDIESRFNKQDEDSILTDLRNQYKFALEEGEYDKAQKINEKIVDFKTEQKLNAIIANQKAPEEQVKVKSQVYSDPQDISDASKLTSEKSEDGSLLRPWLQPNHPQFQDVVDIVAAMSNKYIRKGEKPSLSSIMQEVDKMMGVKKGTSKETTLKHPAVLSSNTTIGVPSENPDKLTSLESSYARKLGIDDKSYAKMKKYGSGPISVENF